MLRQQGISCEECRAIHNLSDPPCEQCRPELDENNADAWEAYQLVCIESMGPTLQGIEIACRKVSDDPDECMIKVCELVRSVMANKDSPRMTKEGTKWLANES